MNGHSTRGDHHGPMPRPVGGGAAEWALAVYELAGTLVPVVAICPDDETAHGALATRLRRGGWKRVYPADWDTGRWPTAPAGALDVAGGELVRLTTGTASVYAHGALVLMPLWRSAAYELRRAVVALVPPGTFPAAAADPDADPEEMGALLRAAPRLLAAQVTVRFDVFTGPRPS